jgi:hypothetical protein
VPSARADEVVASPSVQSTPLISYCCSNFSEVEVRVALNNYGGEERRRVAGIWRLNCARACCWGRG